MGSTEKKLQELTRQRDRKLAAIDKQIKVVEAKKRALQAKWNDVHEAFRQKALRVRDR